MIRLAYMRGRAKFNDAIDRTFTNIVGAITSFIMAVGELVRFGWVAVRSIFESPFRWNEIVSHMEFVGNKSVIIICLSGVFTGLALAYQIYLGFKLVNMTALVGPTVGLGVLRELGPVLTGLIVSARAGGAMAARLGTMRVTEQIDALEVMGVDPVQYLVGPRIVAATIAMPLLTGIFDFVAMAGCWLICIGLFGIDQAAFWSRTTAYLQPYHLFEGLFKAALFGFFFGIICTERGYRTKGGAEGVGNATNQGVVTSMVMIIIIDFFITNLINVFYKFQKLYL